MGESYQEEVSKAPIPSIKHFEFILKTKLNHLQVYLKGLWPYS